mgnify:CR=1 FL=1|jgi:uncharacterized protein YjlB
MMEYHKYFFTDDGTVPNSHLPVIIYSQVVYNSSLSDWFENKFKENNWGNNWRDIVLPYDHFHSNTHEVLALSSGAVSLKIGGGQGKIFDLSAGDVIIIPGGVGHYSVSNHTNYQFIGGYPNGNDWDLRIGLPEERQTVLENLASLTIPKTDPIFGENGLLIDLWK